MAMKVKDLESSLSLGSVKIKTPKGVVGYWKSQWGYDEGKAGVWFTDGKTSQLYPQFVDSLQDCLEWEVTDDPVNCHELTDMEYTDNCTD